MTVGELIDELKKHDRNLPVCMANDQCGLVSIDTVSDEEPEYICITGYDDFDPRKPKAPAKE